MDLCKPLVLNFWGELAEFQPAVENGLNVQPFLIGNALSNLQPQPILVGQFVFGTHHILSLIQM
jgi:hypothetical protein